MQIEKNIQRSWEWADSREKPKFRLFSFCFEVVIL